MSMPTEAFALNPNDNSILRSRAAIDEANRLITHSGGKPLMELTEQMATQLAQVYDRDRVKEAKKLIEADGSAHVRPEDYPPQTHNLEKPLDSPAKVKDELVGHKNEKDVQFSTSEHAKAQKQIAQAEKDYDAGSR